ncbi:hypothetical protein ACHAPU_008086 [Fusarium lateritium]
MRAGKLAIQHHGDNDDARWAYNNVKAATTRLKDTAPFIKDIATPRLCEMSQRSQRGSLLLTETEAQQTKLRTEIQRIVANGWEDATNQLYLPAIHDIRRILANAEIWLREEAADVEAVHKARDRAFLMRRDEIEGQGDVVWSRWDLNDERGDPEGAEALCWRDGYVDKKKAPAWAWTRYDKEDGCGDARGRHG